MRVKQAVFLVGGKGSRLGSQTANTPKPLLEIAPGLRFLDVLLHQAARHGFTDIILLAGYLGDQVSDLYHNRQILDASVSVVREPEPADTGGALLYAADRLEPWFLMANGDTYFEFNLRELTANPSADFVGRLALREVDDVSRYGAVKVRDGKIISFEEKSPVPAPGAMSGGAYLLSKSVLDYARIPSSIEKDIFPALVQRGLLQGQLFSGYFLDIGLPETLRTAREEIPGRLVRPAAFLDRDGVLNHDAGHTHRPEDLVWINGAREAILKLNQIGYYVIVVTNQAGVAKGYYSEADVTRFHDAMQDQLAEIGAHIDAFYYCPYHPDAVRETYRAADHPDRKPNPGMIIKAQKDFSIDQSRSFLVGDKASDVEAARRANIKAVLFDGSDLLATVNAILSQTHDPDHS